jgi:glycosyltransferase involved in cell wall biosynthesis
MQIGLATSTHDLARLVASPIKIFDYMSCGLPIVCSKVGDWGNQVSDSNCGFALSDDSIVQYVAALQTSEKDLWNLILKTLSTQLKISLLGNKRCDQLLTLLKINCFLQLNLCLSHFLKDDAHERNNFNCCHYSQ